MQVRRRRIPGPSSRATAADANPLARTVVTMALGSPPDPPSAGRSRVETEVLEILERADRDPTIADRMRAKTLETRVALNRRSAPGRPANLTPGILLAGSVLLAIAAAALRGVSPLLAVLLGFASFGMLAALWFDRGQSLPSGSRWRGRDLGPDGGPDTVEPGNDRWRGPRR